jgi:tRNA-intron endonuclease, archaea type
VEKSQEEGEFHGEPIRATVKGGKITVDETERSPELEQLGYGEKEDEHHVLKDHEALYLLLTKKLNLRGAKGEELTFEQLAEDAQRRTGDSWSRFIIYRDLRSRGYVAKDGFGFGTDLRVYERGDYPRKAAKYVVFVLDEGSETSVDDLRDSVRQITKMGKEAIVAVVERRGEVIYYKVTRANFKK